MTRRKLITKVNSLAELRVLATTSPSYLALAICGAEQLGGQVRMPNVGARPDDPSYTIALNDAMRVLTLNANETDERGVINEINFVRDCV